MDNGYIYIYFEEQRVLYSSHLSRGDAFNKFSDMTNRKDLYSVKPDAKNSGKGVTPLVMDNNPALPHVSSIIHRYKHLLEKDESLKTIIPRGSVFVSCRKNKTIGGMLIHNRFRPSSSPHSLRTMKILCNLLQLQTLQRSL